MLLDSDEALTWNLGAFVRFLEAASFSQPGRDGRLQFPRNCWRTPNASRTSSPTTVAFRIRLASLSESMDWIPPDDLQAPSDDPYVA